MMLEFNDKNLLFFIIIGVVGIGKSYFINVLYNLLQNKCIVIVIVGKVLYYIKGVIIYLLLKLFVDFRDNKDLIG